MDISTVSTQELQSAIGIMACERMLYSRPPLVEAKIDAQIAFYKAELALRQATSLPAQTTPVLSQNGDDPKTLRGNT